MGHASSAGFDDSQWEVVCPQWRGLRRTAEERAGDALAPRGPRPGWSGTQEPMLTRSTTKISVSFGAIAEVGDWAP